MTTVTENQHLSGPAGTLHGTASAFDGFPEIISLITARGSSDKGM